MNKRTSIPVYLFLLLAFSQAPAGEIYTWVDAGGITHFSETPPEDTDTGAAQVEAGGLAQPQLCQRGAAGCQDTAKPACTFGDFTQAGLP